MNHYPEISDGGRVSAVSAVSAELCSAGTELSRASTEPLLESDLEDTPDESAVCTCGGQAVVEHVQKVLDYLAVTELQHPSHYNALRDLLIYSYEHMHHIAKRKYLLDEICDELEQADYLLSTNPLWRRYQVLKYVYLPSFNAGERLAYASSHHAVAEDNVAKTDVCTEFK